MPGLRQGSSALRWGWGQLAEDGTWQRMAPGRGCGSVSVGPRIRFIQYKQRGSLRKTDSFEPNSGETGKVAGQFLLFQWEVQLSNNGDTDV